MKTIYAIDPGASGGIAVQHGGCKPYTFTFDTQGDIVDFFKVEKEACALNGNTPVVVMEHQVGMRGAFAKLLNGFQFGENYGFIKGVIQANGLRLELVRPQKWQKDLRLGSKGQTSSTDWKNKLKTRAQQLYPDLKVTLKTADALLILEWARKEYDHAS